MGCPFPPDSFKKASCVWELDYDGSRSQIVCSWQPSWGFFFSLKKEITKNGRQEIRLKRQFPLCFIYLPVQSRIRSPDTGAWTEVTRNKAVISRFLIWCVDRELEFYQFGWFFSSHFVLISMEEGSFLCVIHPRVSFGRKISRFSHRLVHLTEIKRLDYLLIIVEEHMKKAILYPEIISLQKPWLIFFFKFIYYFKNCDPLSHNFNANDF